MSALLIVDANPQMRERLISGLTDCGFTVATAAHAIEALDLVRERALDAIVLDVKLPRIDGISLIPLIRRFTQIPIIMVSERLDLATRIAALAAGADDFLTKPFDLSELAARINSALRRPHLGRTSAGRVSYPCRDDPHDPQPGPPPS